MNQQKMNALIMLGGLLFALSACSPSSVQTQQPEKASEAKALLTKASTTTPSPSRGCNANYNFEDAFYAGIGRLAPGKEQIGAYVRRIFQDSDGNIWFGTNQYGVGRFDGRALIYFSVEDGLGGTQITGIHEDKTGNLWFTTDGGVTVYDGESFKNYTKEDGLPSNWVWSILEDSKGQIWIGTLEGLCQFKDDHFVAIELPESNAPDPMGTLSINRIMCMTEDAAGNIWIGTDGKGMYHYDGAVFTSITSESGLAGNSISSIVPDEKGGLWLGSMYNGVSYYQDGKVQLQFKAHDTIGNDEVWKVYKDQQGEIWFSSEGFGVYRYDGEKLRNYSELEGLMVPAVQSIFEDRMGRIWVGGGGGLFRLDGEKFVNIKKGGPWDNC